MISIGRRLAEGVDVDVISLGTTWHSLNLCDKDMNPVTPPYLWNNMEQSAICEEQRLDPNYIDRFYKSTGCMVHAMYPVFELEYLKKQGLYKREYLLINIGTYFTWRMSGERVSTLCMASGSGFLNIRSGQYDMDILQEHDIDECQMSSIIPPGETVRLSRCAAILLGLKAGIPIIPAEPDGGLNQVGVGAEDNEPHVFLPFLYGERCPGWQDKRLAKFTQLRPQHTIFDMYICVNAICA